MVESVKRQIKVCRSAGGSEAWVAEADVEGEREVAIWKESPWLTNVAGRVLDITGFWNWEYMVRMTYILVKQIDPKDSMSYIYSSASYDQCVMMMTVWSCQYLHLAPLPVSVVMLLASPSWSLVRPSQPVSSFSLSTLSSLLLFLRQYPTNILSLQS